MVVIDDLDEVLEEKNDQGDDDKKASYVEWLFLILECGLA